MDDIVEDARREVEVLLLAWQTQGNSGGIFRPYVNDLQRSESTSSEYYSGEASAAGEGSAQGAAPVFVVSDMSSDIPDREGLRMARKSSSVSPMMTTRGNGNSDLLGIEEELIATSTASEQDRLIIGRGGGTKRVAWDDN